jgi:hypothetical protein
MIVLLTGLLTCMRYLESYCTVSRSIRFAKRKNSVLYFWSSSLLVVGHFPPLFSMLFTSEVLSAANWTHSYIMWSTFCWSAPQGHYTQLSVYCLHCSTVKFLGADHLNVPLRESVSCPFACTVNASTLTT